MINQECRWRSVIKTLTFRAVIVIFDFTVLMVLTGRYVVAASLTVGVNLVRTVFYYFHERLWDKISWGRKRKISLEHKK